VACSAIPPDLIVTAFTQRLSPADISQLMHINDLSGQSPKFTEAVVQIASRGAILRKRQLQTLLDAWPALVPFKDGLGIELDTTGLDKPLNGGISCQYLELSNIPMSGDHHVQDVIEYLRTCMADVAITYNKHSICRVVATRRWELSDTGSTLVVTHRGDRATQELRAWYPEEMPSAEFNDLRRWLECIALILEFHTRLPYPQAIIESLIPSHKRAIEQAILPPAKRTRWD
jgi:hypothetical protein